MKKPKAKTVARIILFVTLPVWILPAAAIGVACRLWDSFNDMLDEV